MSRNAQVENRLAGYAKARRSGLKPREAVRAIGLKSHSSADRYEAVLRERERKGNATAAPDDQILARTLWAAIVDPTTPANLLPGLSRELRALLGWGRSTDDDTRDNARSSIADLLRSWGREDTSRDMSKRGSPVAAEANAQPVVESTTSDQGNHNASYRTLATGMEDSRRTDSPEIPPERADGADIVQSATSAEKCQGRPLADAGDDKESE